VAPSLCHLRRPLLVPINAFRYQYYVYHSTFAGTPQVRFLHHVWAARTHRPQPQGCPASRAPDPARLAAVKTIAQSKPAWAPRFPLGTGACRPCLRFVHLLRTIHHPPTATSTLGSSQTTYPTWNPFSRKSLRQASTASGSYRVPRSREISPSTSSMGKAGR
jgi:hypothetical protein